MSEKEPERTDHLFSHTMPKADVCQHDFKGWREFADGMGAMAHTLSLDF